MTWNGLCPTCRGRCFTLTVNSEGIVHVNCADETCSTYIGRITRAGQLHPPTRRSPRNTDEYRLNP